MIDPVAQKAYEEKYLVDGQGKKRKPLYKQMNQRFERVNNRKIQKKLKIIKETVKPYDYDALREHDEKIKTLLMEQKQQRDNKFKLRRKQDVEL